MRGGLTDPLAQHRARRRLPGPPRSRRPLVGHACAGAATTSSTPSAPRSSAPTRSGRAPLFSHGAVQLTCGRVPHGRAARASPPRYPGAPQRTVHSHQFPGVDLALTELPPDGGAAGAAQASLDTTLQAALCVKGGPAQATIQVVLDNVGAGHEWPSGATAGPARVGRGDRVRERADASTRAASSPTGRRVLEPRPIPICGSSATACFDAQGQPVNMFWQAASHDSNQLRGPVTIMRPTRRTTSPTRCATSRRAPRRPRCSRPCPTRVTMRVRLVPVGARRARRPRCRAETSTPA